MERILTTEENNPVSVGIDTKSTLEICRIINDEDKTVPYAVEKALPDIAALVDDVVIAFKKGGRLLYIGAGTSGRLGVLDASECPPTFGVSPELVQGIIAGGVPALTRAIEHAEDDGQAGIQALRDLAFCPDDVLVGITASGEAAFVLEALKYARDLGAVVGAISCNASSRVFEAAKHRIYLPVGPEIIAGSTRMKSGTAQKLALNMITTITMIKMGKVYDNYMVNLVPTNRKLVKRAKKLIKKISDCSDEEVERVWSQCHDDTTVAILMAMKHDEYEHARLQLENSDWNLHKALQLYE
ncbi:MAG: N-acetylmuramic acid 6-phosphate etherase [Spirochaetia bacterium]|nr:N-acetylmuramic acid 6-phosphate etherase [Spirochaetia bacterium]